MMGFMDLYLRMKIRRREKKKWKYYPHPKTKGKCYRALVKGNLVEKEYFMVTPEAKKVP